MSFRIDRGAEKSRQKCKRRYTHIYIYIVRKEGYEDKIWEEEGRGIAKWSEK